MRHGSGLSHPAWWLALVTLLLNDHVLKGAGVLPVWVTGKLSDVAGLVVAPVLVSSVLGAERWLPRLACFTSVAVVFCLLNLSATAAGSVEMLTSQLGIPWVIWTDPTDLVALLVLPLAWTIGGARSSPHGFRSAQRTSKRVGLLERTGAVAGGLACMATAFVLDEVSTAAYLVNTTEKSLQFDLYRATPSFSCDNAHDQLSVDPESAFVWERKQELVPFRALPLDRPDESEEEASECDAVLVDGPTIGRHILFWRDCRRVPIDIDRPMVDGIDPNAVYIERFGGELLLSPSENVEVWPAE